MTKEGGLLYFHRNVILTGDFDKLRRGDEVYYVEDVGDTGPMAAKVWGKGGGAQGVRGRLGGPRFRGCGRCSLGRASSHRHDEQPREAQQYFAIDPRLIGANDFLRVGGEKFFFGHGVERR